MGVTSSSNDGRKKQDVAVEVDLESIERGGNDSVTSDINATDALNADGGGQKNVSAIQSDTSTIEQALRSSLWALFSAAKLYVETPSGDLMLLQGDESGNLKTTPVGIINSLGQRINPATEESVSSIDTKMTDGTQKSRITDGTTEVYVKPGVDMLGGHPGIQGDVEISASVPIYAVGSQDGTTMDAANANPFHIDANKEAHVVGDAVIVEHFTADLGAGALSSTTTSSDNKDLKAVLLHFDASYTGTITVTLDDATGANYDTVLLSVNVSSITDYVFYPSGDLPLSSSDQIKVEATAQAATNVHGSVRFSRRG